LKLYVWGFDTTEKLGENVSTVAPPESTNMAVGEPGDMASLILLTPGVMGKEPEDDPMESWSV